MDLAPRLERLVWWVVCSVCVGAIFGCSDELSTDTRPKTGTSAEYGVTKSWRQSGEFAHTGTVRVRVEVLDSGEGWTEFRYDEEMGLVEGLVPELQAKITGVDHVPLVLRVSRDWRNIEIRNWNELSGVMGRILEELLQVVERKYGPEVLEQVRPMYESMLTEREMIENTVLKGPRMYFSVMGHRGEDSVPQVLDAEYPGPNGGTIPGQSTVTLSPTPADDGVEIQLVNEAFPDEAEAYMRRWLREQLEDAGMDPALADQLSVSLVARDEATGVVNHGLGLPVSLEYALSQTVERPGDDGPQERALTSRWVLIDPGSAEAGP